MKSKTKISKDLKFKRNPRKITDAQLELLRNHLSELGDLSGVIYCHNNKSYVGGNQRSDVFDNSQIEITERFSEPTKQKTLAHGFIVWQGEKYAYREVAFTEQEFKKACIVANHDGGSWDMDILRTEFDIPELAEWGFEVPEFETVQIPQAEYHGFKEYRQANNESTQQPKQIIGNPEFKEYDETITDDIKICKCEKCGHEHTAKKD